MPTARPPSAPPSHSRHAHRRRRRRPPLSAIELIVINAIGMPTGAILVLDTTLATWLIETASIQGVAVGMAAGLAMYLWSLPDGEPIQYRRAAIRTVTGGVWGFIAAKAAGGMGWAEQAQTASAGVAGAKGPDLIDHIVSKIPTGKG